VGVRAVCPRPCTPHAAPQLQPIHALRLRRPARLTPWIFTIDRLWSWCRPYKSCSDLHSQPKLMSPPTKILVGYVPGIPGGVDAYAGTSSYSTLDERWRYQCLIVSLCPARWCAVSAVRRPLCVIASLDLFPAVGSIVITHAQAPSSGQARDVITHNRPQSKRRRRDTWTI